MFTGLSAFPLTPLDDDRLDEHAYATLVTRLADAGVDSIGALGSTGSYAYLTRDERARAVQLAVRHAAGTPVIAGIGALRTRHVLQHADDAQRAGAAAVLLAPVSYQPLTDDEVYHLYEQVTAALSVPLVVYDNPRTTGFTFTDDSPVPGRRPPPAPPPTGCGPWGRLPAPGCCRPSPPSTRPHRPDMRCVARRSRAQW
ncbi:hypothetical protein Aph02nite_47430 [Actinoplanes philippinensis]|uniref:4-hydroxy-tetrahydrodipicolinate synthase n=1 Tax=Actinoplanes philippinensis TaxID=35752 RepID=A0A1I2HZK1_9ACTN|nr:dihydrodipicolinate synthase family protein [Actinoplanes philippinensis]GIE78793.1 hypothetical protein Aph02nite_47430 [Actinoplanes philippinensis]SFF35444.1 4-hydroxy-tetrahydrodipicolinate synthase [Actinoplanes philippinensis]